MSDKLRFDSSAYEIKSFEAEGRTVVCRAFTGLDYCEYPADPIQKLNIYVPEIYYEGGTLNGYSLDNAPIFMPNTAGGYMEGPGMEPGFDHFTRRVNSAFEGLFHGYVVACAGVRGRNTGENSREFFVGNDAEASQEKSGRLVGRAPAFVVDMKAAIRYLRHNRDVIPGDTEHIITNGTSAGGALSALTGASGNAAVFEPYLKEIGAADERDDIFGASCYCPIHNLENADPAYEWLFKGHNEFHMMRFEKKDGHVVPTPVDGIMDETQIALSEELADLFPAYLNSLNLKDEEGNPLTLDDSGEGSFKEYIRKLLLRSASRELATRDSGTRLAYLAVPGSAIDEQDYITVSDGYAAALDWDAFVTKITRMKTAPAFDAVDLRSAECEEFGDEAVYARHFTDFSTAHDTAGGDKAPEELIRMMNPTSFIGNADSAPHWRIRHGAFDRDTSLAIPVILATLLKNHGYDVDFALPWGLPHSGDYDLDELFSWIDTICQNTGDGSLCF